VRVPLRLCLAGEACRERVCCGLVLVRPP
jgi:hypothetical protein